MVAILRIFQKEKDDCITMQNLKNTCENELSNVVSTKNQLYPITPNGGIPSSRCTEGSNWMHSCVKTNNISIAEN